MSMVTKRGYIIALGALFLLGLSLPSHTSAAIIYYQGDITGSSDYHTLNSTFVASTTGEIKSAATYGSAFNRNLFPFGPTSRSATWYIGSSTATNIPASGDPYCTVFFNHDYGGDESLQYMYTNNGDSSIASSTTGGCDVVAGQTYGIQFGDSAQESFALSWGAPYGVKNNSNTNYAIGLYTDSVPPTFIDTTTHIIDITPEDGSTISGPNITFSISAYISPKDIGTFSGIDISLKNLDQNVFLLPGLSPATIDFLRFFPATTSGAFYFATTSAIADGNYQVTGTLAFTGLDSILHIFSGNVTKSNQFIIGQGTFIGNITQNTNREINSLFASTTGTTTIGAASNCNPFAGQWNVILCGGFLFQPDQKGLTDSINNLESGVLNRAPWGYFQRFYNILTTTSTSSLPAYTVNVIIGPGNATTSLSFDPGDMLAGGGSLLASIHDPLHGMNDQDVFGPLVQLGFAFTVLFIIIKDITGSHKHDSDIGDSKNTKLR